MPESRRIFGTERTPLSRWVTLVTRRFAFPDEAPQPYHSLALADYVTVLAVTEDGRIPLVRQFRPAVEKVTLELPGGLLDADETPAAIVARELEEETGYTLMSEAILLGELMPDSGRLENRFWCYFGNARALEGWTPEPGVERVLYTAGDLRHAIMDGTFDHALHVALVGLALIRGYLKW